VSARPISRAAYAAQVRSGAALAQWQRIYAHIQAQPGVTRAEIEAATGIRINAVSGRVHDLLAGGLVAEGDARTCTATGREAHPLYPARAFRGGDSAGFSPQQVALWEREQAAEKWAGLARFVLAMPRADQVRFYRRWQARHGEA
jgi:hypothetical protein